MYGLIEALIVPLPAGVAVLTVSLQPLAGTTPIWNDLPADRGGVLESVTRMSPLKVPVVFGVPAICPLLALSDRPGGSDPKLENVYGGVPPRAMAVPLKGRLSSRRVGKGWLTVSSMGATLKVRS